MYVAMWNYLALHHLLACEKKSHSILISKDCHYSNDKSVEIINQFCWVTRQTYDVPNIPYKYIVYSLICRFGTGI
jgi:hypothetical protein